MLGGGQETRAAGELGPFRSRPQALGFVLVLAGVLSSPLIVEALGPPSREDTYRSLGAHPGTFHHRVLFEEDEPLDVVVIGGSRTQYGLDAGHLERSLSAQLGRPATVRALGHYGACAEVKYIFLKDLLARREVRAVVLSAPPSRQETVDPWAHRLFQVGEHWDDWSGLPAEDRARFYALNVVSTPRQVRFAAWDETRGPFMAHMHLDTTMANRGSIRSSVGWKQRFRRVDLPARGVPVDQVLHREPNERVRFTGEASPYQVHFFRKIFELVSARGIPLVLIVPPSHDRRDDAQVRVLLPDAPVPVVGLPPRELFAGLDPDTILALYQDNEHFNRNGSALYTRTLTPAILSALADRP